MSKKKTSTLIIRRLVLESPGCDNIEMVMAARDKHSGDIDVKERLAKHANDEKTSRRVKALFGELLSKVVAWWKMRSCKTVI